MKWLRKLFNSFNKRRAMKVALCVGHSRKIKGRLDGGSISVDGTSEWEFNSRLADRIADELEIMGVEVRVWSDYKGPTYTASMLWLGEKVEEWGADCALELHFNSAQPGVSGHEWLYWSSSDQGLLLAAELNKFMVHSFPEIRQRGPKAIKPRGRGAGFLRLTHCPAVITEPFFGSSTNDWESMNSRIDDLVAVHVEAICEWGSAEGLLL